MDHVAIMKKAWGLVPKILSGEKIIESRWYKARYSPWNRIKNGDIVYFKNSGEQIGVKAEVSKVLQFILMNDRNDKSIQKSQNRSFDFALRTGSLTTRNNLRCNFSTVKGILQKYGKQDGLGITDIPRFYELFKDKKYCILVFLKNPKRIKPFDIDKTGYGVMSAWISVANINSIKLPRV